MRHGRQSLALAYVLAGLLAQGFHDHGERDRDEASAKAPCQERRTHVESRAPSTTAPHPDDCLSCQHRAQSHLGPSPAPRLDSTLVDALSERPRPIARRISHLRPTGRAPPRA